MYDAVIVGGGPVGSRVAYRLGEQRYSVLVLEKKSRPGTKTACTGIIGQECAEAFQIEDRLILKRVNSASLFSPSGIQLYLRREEPQACILDRPALDIAMAERAQEAGAEYSFKSRVTGIGAKGGCAIITFEREGKEQAVAARVAVVACGFNPGLLERLGLGLHKDHAIGAQAEVEAPGAGEVEVYFGDMAPGFFAWLVPTVPPLAVAGLLSRETPGHYLKIWLAELAGRNKIKSAEAKISYGGIPLKPLPRTCGDRLIAVGDAAGQVKPTSGGGIYYGLLSADIAAEALVNALADNDLSSGRLARYEHGWRKRLGRELRTGYWFRKIYERLSYRQIDRIFEIIRRRGIDTALLKAEDLSFDWHSRTIMKLLKYQVVVKTTGQFRLPFKTGEIDR